ncbi:hypothetical protein L7750_18430 [Xenorhabdus bovienii]|uniref:PE-PGRS family protein (Modular protein) n=1 Tax=Xenorhabdus bovienii str. kraussei Becker Underwood TaxID=1398204 RepID=A0A077PQS1_XENBV|nr:hypothetical protein [Xenorhabdus bovienii]MCG3472279.1 hypothetical protein [Xenorhabdus bovienii]CDH26625.1 PE-PGRS family protein (modular protein) [Xenorhabdus bovienii str. kraussei Becker Underwood]
MKPSIIIIAASILTIPFVSLHANTNAKANVKITDCNQLNGKPGQDGKNGIPNSNCINGGNGSNGSSPGQSEGNGGNGSSSEQTQGNGGDGGKDGDGDGGKVSNYHNLQHAGRHS